MVTTKESNHKHGLGLENVKKAANRYGGYLKHKRKDDVFEASVIIHTS